MPEKFPEHVTVPIGHTTERSFMLYWAVEQRLDSRVVTEGKKKNQCLQPLPTHFQSSTRISYKIQLHSEQENLISIVCQLQLLSPNTL